MFDRSFHRFASRIALLALAAACGGGSDSTSPTPTPTITVTAAPATLTLSQGQSGTATIGLTRGGSYTGAVALAVTGAPTGVTVTPAPASLTGTTASSTLTIAAAATATPGTYTLAVAGSGTGVTTSSAAVTLVVTAATPTSNTLTVTTDGTGAGKITSAPAGIDCPTVCSASFASTATVVLTAVANTGSTFGGWSGACSGSITTCTLPMSAARNATATFSQIVSTVALTVATSGTGAGTVTSSPAGITCPGTCTTNVAAGTVVTLTAAPNATSTFAGWGAPCATSTLTTCAVTVNAAQTVTATFTATPAGSYALAVSPASVTVAQGAASTTQVNVTRTNGFAGAVALTVAGAPNGLTITPNPTSVTGASSSLAIAATTTTTPGTYTITVSGTAAGVPAQTATFTVQVTATSSGGGNVTFGYAGCDAVSKPIWLAAQDGNGAWTRITPDANASYRFNIGTRGGVAYVTQDAGTYELNVYYASGTEFTTLASGNQCGLAPRGTKRLTGTVTGVGATNFVSIALGGASESVFGGQSAFTLDSVAAGPLDLIASRATIGTTGFLLDRLIIRRGVNYATTIPTLDFGSSESFAPVQRTLTLGNLGTDDGFASVGYVTANGSSAPFFSGIGTGATIPYFGIPSSQQAAGDLHELVAGAAPASTNATTSRFLYTFFRDATDRTVTLGPTISAASVTSLATAPYARLRATFGSQVEYSGYASAIFTQTTRSTIVSTTAGYFGGTPATWTIDVPDLSGAAGFDATWGLRTGTSASWTVTALGGDVLALSGQTPNEGSQIRAASRSGSAAALRTYLRSQHAAAPTDTRALR